MKKLFTNIKSLLVVLITLPTTMAVAQYTGAYQMASFGYTYGITPSGANVADANAAYESWKSNFVTSSQGCGYRRVIFDFYSGGLGKTDKSQTVSEGIAYGMLLAAYKGDRSLFDDLWGYYKSKRNGNGVMNWKIENCGVVGANGASDAELDVAMALIIASEQWQTDSYLNDAKSMIAIIRTKEFEGNILKPGDQFGGNNLTNPSYNSPAYYRVFKTYDGNANFWDAAASKGYQTIAGSPGASKGLVPDWSNGDGGYSNSAGQYTDQGRSFFFDAVRTPFRSAIDYLWHGNADALAYLNKFNSWAMSAHGGNIANTGSKYNMNGDKTQTYNNATFSACFAVAAMASTGNTYQSYLNGGYNHLKNNGVGYGEYFNATFKALGLFVMTGNFFLPKQCTNKPELGADKSLCVGSSVTVSTTAVGGATYSWKKDGVAISGNSNSITASTSGVYELTMTSGGCAARDKVTVFGSTLKADFIAVAGPGNLTVTDNTLGGVKGTSGTGYTYTITPPTGSPTTQTTPNFTLNSIANGKYTIQLDVTNAGFGCSGTSTITKIIAVGDGVGVAIDDFEQGNQAGNYPYVDGTKIKPIEKTWCSKQDYLDGADKVCPVFPCGNWILDFTGSGAAGQYQPVGIDFSGNPSAPFDLTDVPFVAIRASATKPIKMYVKLNQKTSTIDFSNNSSVANEISLTTTPQVFNLDFSTLLAGWDSKASKAATITAWNHVTGVSIFPFDNGTAKINATYDGVVTIDYIIVGAKGIPAPTFNIKKDELGFTDYGVYLKDYYPNDPKYAACTPSTEGSACYGSVPDWKKSVALCGSSTVLEAKSCTANEIRWYKDGALLGTGATYAATAGGTYVVELSNIGGVTKDTVVVSAKNTVADFTVDQDNFDVKFFNSSTDYSTWVWDFGVTGTGNYQDKLAQTTVWDPAYYGYTEEGNYNVKLTVTDTVCNVSKSVTKPIVVTCTGPSAVNLVSNPAKTTFCKDESATFTAKIPTANAADYAWFLPLNAIGVPSLDTLGQLKDTVVFTNKVKFGLNSSGPVELQIYGSCLDKKSSKTIEVTVTDPVVSDFEILDQIDDKVYFNEKTSNAESLVWTFGASPNATSTTSEEASPIVSFKETGTFSVCLKANNATCNTTNTKCKDVTIEIIGLASKNSLSAKFVAFPNPVMGGNVEFSTTINNVVIIDALGNEIAKAASLNSYDVSNLAAGVYFIKSDEGTARVVVK